MKQITAAAFSFFLSLFVYGQTDTVTNVQLFAGDGQINSSQCPISCPNGCYAAVLGTSWTNVTNTDSLTVYVNGYKTYTVNKAVNGVVIPCCIYPGGFYDGFIAGVKIRRWKAGTGYDTQTKFITFPSVTNCSSVQPATKRKK